MTRVPFTGPEALPSPGTISVPDAYQQIDTRGVVAAGAAFAQGAEKLAAGIRDAGNVVSEIAIRNQQEENKLAVNDAQNQLEERIQRTGYGDPNDPSKPGYFSQRGRAALDGFNDAAEGLDQFRRHLTSGLHNPVQQQQFDQQAARMVLSARGALLRHRDQEQRAFADQTDQGALALARSGAALAWNDDGNFAARMGQTEQIVRDMGARNGWAQDKVDAEVQHGQAQLVQDRAQRLVGEGDAIGAQAFVRNNAARLPANVFSTLSEHTRNAANRQVGMGLADEETNRYGGAAAGRVSLSGAAAGLAQRVSASAGEQGVSPALALTVAGIESNMGQAPDRAGSQYIGPYQMGDGAWAARGGTAANRRDPDAQVRLGIANLAHSRDVAKQATGRDAAPWEAYLVHQQGDGGGAALLRADAGQSAVSALMPAYRGNEAAARAAVVQNGGRADMTAGEFRDVWRNRYQAAEAKYAGGEAASTGGGWQQDRPAGPPDLPTMIANIQRRAAERGASPEALDIAISKVTATYHQQQQATGHQRSEMEREARDTNAALLDGRNVATLPEARIRSLFPADQATRMVQEQANAQQVGQMVQRVAGATPAEIQEMLSDLDTGKGINSTMLRLRQGRTLATGPDGQPVAANDDPVDYRERRKQQGHLLQALRVREQALLGPNADPAAYAAQQLQQNPDVAPVLLAAQGPQAVPEQRAAAVRAVLAEQARLGVPEEGRTALPAGVVRGLVQQLTRTDPSKADMGLELDKLAQSYGSAWDEVFGSLVTVGKLPREYQALAIMTRESQIADRAAFQRALSTAAAAGGAAKLRSAAGDAAKEIDRELEGKMAEFRATLAYDRGATRLINETTDSVKMLAYQYAIQGQSSSAALEAAYQGIIGKTYDFSGTMRVPKGRLGEARAATREAVQGLTAEGLADIGGEANSTPEERRRDFLASIHSRGQWVPMTDDGGLQLVVRGRDNVIRQAVRSDGTPVVVRFNAMRPAAPLDPAALAASGAWAQ